MQPRLAPPRTAVLALEPNWGLVALRGILALILAVAAFLAPQPTVATLGLLVGIYALIDGLAAIAAALRRRAGASRFPLLLEGIAGVVLGVLILVLPGAGTIALVTLVAAWSILTGIFELLLALRLRQELPGELLTLLGGLASLALGVLLLVSPGAGVTAVAWLIGAYAFVYAVLMLTLALRLRGRHELAQGPTAMIGRPISPTTLAPATASPTMSRGAPAGSAGGATRMGIRQGNRGSGRRGRGV